MTNKTTEQRWTDAANALLKGKVVDHVRYLTDAESDDLGWHKRAVVIFFTDGTCVFPSCDDEGNDAAALFTGSESLPVIPVI